MRRTVSGYTISFPIPVKTKKQTGLQKKSGMWQIHLQCHLFKVPALITFFTCKVNTAKKDCAAQGGEQTRSTRAVPSPLKGWHDMKCHKQQACPACSETLL